MKMYDCDVCLSAGSVNKWGYCEICGEEFEDPGSKVISHVAALNTASITAAARLAEMMPTANPREMAAVGK